MKYLINIRKSFNLLFLNILLCSQVFAGSTVPEIKKSRVISFIENKGQICDQYNNPRPDVLFTAKADGMSVHYKSNGFSYQIYKPVTDHTAKSNADSSDFLSQKTMVHRIDVDFVNSNSSVDVVSEGMNADYDNYYLTFSNKEILNIRNYNSIWYKSIYSGIDVHYFTKGGKLKYDYLVGPNIDYKQIKLEIKGANAVSVNNEGQLVLSTEIGDIVEEKPIVYQGTKQINASWKVEGNIVSFNIGNYDKNKALLIDPLTLVRHWGTYYGGGGDDMISDLKLNSMGEIIGCGNTQSGSDIATIGSYQDFFLGAGGFIVKFASNGTRIWGTYYHAGSFLGYSNLSSISIDNNNNIYVCGTTSNSLTTVFATSGAFQSSYNGGSWDGIFAKFDNSGARLYGSYYGDFDFDQITSIALDKNKNIFMSGVSKSIPGTALTTNSSYQPNNGGGFYDGFLVKFDSLFNRQWGTFYGDVGSEYLSYVAVDKVGNSYLLGNTTSSNNISTPGSHQIVPGGFMDMYLVKFDKYGNRKWATFYGGSSDEFGNTITSDTLCNIYIGGTTNSYSNNISTPSSYQPAYSNSQMDGFIVKFDSSGVRQWGTYYGGASTDEIKDLEISTDKTYLLVGGKMQSYVNEATPPFATIDAHQKSHGSGFYSIFNLDGTRVHSSYYGSSGSTNNDTQIIAIAMNTNSEVIVGGFTDFRNVSPYSYDKYLISSQGSHQVIHGGVGRDGFMAKMGACNVPISAEIVLHTNISCIGYFDSNIHIAASGGSSFTYTWSPMTAPAGTNISQAKTETQAYALLAGTYTCNIMNSCGSSTAVILNVTQPTLNLSVVSNTNSVCLGDSINLTAYCDGVVHWMTSPVINPTSSGTVYTSVTYPPATETIVVYGRTSLSCPVTSTVEIPIIVKPVPYFGTLTSGGNGKCEGSFRTFTVTANPASSYSWSVGSSTLSTNSAYMPPTDSVTVIAFSPLGCKSSWTFPFKIRPKPKVTNLQDTVYFCSILDSVIVNPTITSGNPPYLYYTFGLMYSQTTSSFVITSSNTKKYYYQVEDWYCISRDSVQVMDLCTGFDENQDQKRLFTIYPNPNNGESWIRGNDSKSPINIEIYDLTGRLIARDKYTQEQYKISLINYENGLYFIKLKQNGNLIGSFKVVKN